MKTYEVAILGASGPTGTELADILAGHLNIADIATPSRQELAEFEGREVVFSALGHGKSAEWVAKFRSLGCTVIDLSGDLRFPTTDQYEKWYQREHPAPQLLNEKVPYGLPEINRDQLKSGEKLVSMPGCYPTATILALAPLIERGLLDPSNVITVTAGSGYSGRGKDADISDVVDSDSTGFNARPYKTGRVHPHVGEMERQLDESTLLFAPKVLPIERGILVQAVAKLAEGVYPAAVAEAFEEAYGPEPFVAFAPEGSVPDIAETAHSDECHIGFVAVKNTILAGSSIDNLRKGASSQAVQAFNLIHGLPEETGLTPKNGWQPTAR